MKGWLNEVLMEIDRAERLYPDWPTDRIEQAAIVAEEAGEVLKVALNLRPGDPHSSTTSIEDFKNELVQTAAMALRALKNLP